MIVFIEDRMENLYVFCFLIMYKKQKIYVYNDRNLFVLNKNYNITCHKNHYNYIGMIDYLKNNCNNIYLIHRLDKQVYGLLLISKNIKMLRYIGKLFNKKMIIKEYYAIIYGYVIKIIDFIKNTVCKLILNKLCYSFVKIQIYTGKIHQIRLYLSYFGNPIGCDYKYGSYIFNKQLNKIGFYRLFLFNRSLNIYIKKKVFLYICIDKYFKKII